MEDPQLPYKIGISLIPGIGSSNARKLIAYLGSVEAVFSEKKRTLQKIPGIGEVLARVISGSEKVLERAYTEIGFIQRKGIHPFFYFDKTYPARLKECPDAPLMLYTKGPSDLNGNRMISIVGTRRPSSYGMAYCEKLVTELHENGYNIGIVSGLAYGIDITAHKAALQNGLPTFAVLGHGLDRIYPPIHRETACRIAETGSMVSEFLSETVPDRQNFVKRNRIIAGLSDATIVIESGLKGGSLITAGMANGYNREVFALPGRVNDPCSAGCNWLIKTNNAALIENLSDLEFYMGWDKPVIGSIPQQQRLFSNLTEEEQLVIALLREYGQLELDLIAMKTRLPVSRISGMLLSLEFSGYVRAMPGKVFTLC
jgi:DNA processing protein